VKELEFYDLLVNYEEQQVIFPGLSVEFFFFAKNVVNKVLYEAEETCFRPNLPLPEPSCHAKFLNLTPEQALNHPERLVVGVKTGVVLTISRETKGRKIIFQILSGADLISLKVQKMSQPGWPIQRIITPLRRQEDPFPVREHYFWHSDTLYWHFVPDRPTEPPPKKPDPPHRRPATDPLDFEQRNAFLEAAQHNRHINSDSPVGKQPHHPPTHHEGKKTKNRHSRHSQPNQH
jgi:hypothetical protein